MGSSRSHRSFKSVTSADRPQTKHFSPVMERISRIASIVSSDEVEVLKKTAITVLWSVLNALYTLSGKNSLGTEMSARLLYHNTLSTCSTCSTFSLSAATSLSGISSRIMNENAPLPNSSIRMFCPLTVSMLSGR